MIRCFGRGGAALMLAAVVVVGSARPCLACSCLESTDEEHFARAEMVFVGVAVERHDPGGPFGSAQTIHWTFDVESVQKGRPADPQQVSSAKDSAACGWVFEVGQRYQVFADRSDGGEMVTGLCTGTRHLAAGQAPYEPPTPPPPPPPLPSPGPTEAPTPTPTAAATLIPTPTLPQVTTTPAPGPADPAVAVSERTGATWSVVTLLVSLAALGAAAALALRRPRRR